MDGKEKKTLMHNQRAAFLSPSVKRNLAKASVVGTAEEGTRLL